MNTDNTVTTTPRRRGPGKRPAMTLTSLRLPLDVAAFFDAMPNKQKAMRTVLADYVAAQKAADTPPQ